MPLTEIIDHKCIKCHKQFDIIKNNGTTICEQSHQACEDCLQELLKNNQNCPQCHNVLKINSPFQNNIKCSYSTNKQQWEPVGQQPYFNKAHPYSIYYHKQDGQQFELQQKRMKKQINVNSKSMLKKVIIFMVIAILLFFIRVQMSSCWIWGYKSCEYGFEYSYCCPFSADCPANTYRQDYCKYLLEIQIRNLLDGTSTLAIVFTVLAILFFGLYSAVKQIERNRTMNSYEKV